MLGLVAGCEQAGSDASAGGASIRKPRAGHTNFQAEPSCCKERSPSRASEASVAPDRDSTPRDPVGASMRILIPAALSLALAMPVCAAAAVALDPAKAP